MSRVLCAWCGADLGPATTAKDSHGICPACEAKLEATIPPEKAMDADIRWLDELCADIASLRDADSTVSMALNVGRVRRIRAYLKATTTEAK